MSTYQTSELLSCRGGHRSEAVLPGEVARRVSLFAEPVSVLTLARLRLSQADLPADSRTVTPFRRQTLSPAR